MSQETPQRTEEVTSSVSMNGTTNLKNDMEQSVNDDSSTFELTVQPRGRLRVSLKRRVSRSKAESLPQQEGRMRGADR